jgi:hypothetical protein
MGRKELDSTNDAADVQQAQPSVDSAALVAELNAEIESSKLKLPVASERFGISVDAFEKLFVSEDAPEGYIVYHTMMKDENIQVTPWSPQSTSLGHAREIRFLKPVNLPGLVSTRAKKVGAPPERNIYHHIYWLNLTICFPVATVSPVR